MAQVYHVAKSGCDHAAGSQAEPFFTINRAARVAMPGDTVIVHEGEYREWVKPQNSGLNDVTRITYEASPGEHVVIKGSERVIDWAPMGDGVWKAVLPNTFFGDFNPYSEQLYGDWLISPKDGSVHLGDVYLNGVSFFEAKSLADVYNPQMRRIGFPPPWSPNTELVRNPEQSAYQWFAQINEHSTTIYANFHGADPNVEVAEINVRKCCFYPEQAHIDFITVRGFEIAQAACPWAPPTADQPGMLGAHWSLGWVMENNDLHDAKCSAISIGKEGSTGHNLHSRTQRKPGYQYQMEAVFRGLQVGWCKEKIGSHVIRNNTIHDCGQNGIVGHMGCVFSRIEHNHIYNIATKHEYFGYEIAGIKLHAAVDVVIENNHIHDCTLGTWLDWQAQGTRITRNVMHHNDRDLMIEVTHGPCLVDNNILASDYNFDNAAQGTAYVHNLCCGYMRRIKVLDRATPYHFPHTTQVAGCAVVYSGDDRLYRNLFTFSGTCPSDTFYAGTAGYDDCTTPQEYPELLKVEGNTDTEKYYKISQPAYVDENAYYGQAKGFRSESNGLHAPGFDTGAKVTLDGDKAYLEISLPARPCSENSSYIGTACLGMPRITEALFENPDGSSIQLNTDLNGAQRAALVTFGPLEAVGEGYNRIQVWG
jgi:alpha-N-arabinofuranosidase